MTATAQFEDIMAGLPLVAILRGITPAEVEAVGDVLVAHGFRLIEVPVTSPEAFRSIALLVHRLSAHVIVGAGTVRQVEQLERLADAGGRLVVTPHADTALIRAASGRRLITLPGVATPTEAFAALDAGAHGLKLFPSDMIPPAAVKALRAVVGPRVHLCPTGGIGPGDLSRYVAAGATGFGLGGALYRPGDRPDDVRAKAETFAASWRAIIRSDETLVRRSCAA